MRQIPQLQLADCRALVAAAAAEASGRQATVSIAVVDPGGQPLLLQRGDGASPASTAALAKAAMAALNGKPTAALEAAINGERPALLQLALSLPVPAVAMAGGLPLLLDGVCLGGIGVSGMTPEIDGAIAAAGVAALTVTPPV